MKTWQPYFNPWLVVPPLLLFVFAAGFNGLFGSDSHTQLAFSRSIASYMFGDGEVAASWWPANYPLAAALLNWLNNAPLAMQLISLTAFVGVLYNMRSLLKFLWPKRPHSFFMWAFVALSPYLLRASVVAMADMLCLYFITGSLLAFAWFKRYANAPALSAFALLSGLAVTTQYTALVVLFPFMIAISWEALRRWKFVPLGLAFFLFFIAWLPEWALKGTDFSNSFSGPYFTSWNAANWFKAAFNEGFGASEYVLPNIVFAFNSLVHPGFLIAGIAFVWFFRREDLEVHVIRIGLLGFLLYSLFVAGIPYQNNRVMLLSFPVVLLAINPAFDRFLLWLGRWPTVQKMFPAALLVLQLGLCTIPFYRAWSYTHNEQQIAEYLTVNHSHETVLTVGKALALESYRVPLEINPTVEAANAKGSLLLYNAEAAKSMVSNRSLAALQAAIGNRERFELLHEFNDDWQLYRIQ